MEDSRTVSAAAAFAAAALSLALAAGAQPVSPKRDTPARGATGLAGAIVHHEESAGGRIVYFEEQGGNATAATAPVKSNGAGTNGNDTAKPGPVTSRRVAPLPPRVEDSRKK